MKALIAIPLFVTLLSCDEPAGTDETTLGYLQVDDNQPRVEVPVTGRVGQPLLITFDTWGGNTGSGCVNEGESRIQEVEAHFRITAVGQFTDACVDTWVRLHNEVTVIPKSSGSISIEIIGRKFPGNDQITVSHQVLVTP